MKISKATRRQVNGTSLQGYVTATYADLVKKFGKPAVFEGDKVRAEWMLDIDGTIVTIYDWKETIDVRNVTDWHIGGNGASAVLLLSQILPNARKAF